MAQYKKKHNQRTFLKSAFFALFQIVRSWCISRDCAFIAQSSNVRFMCFYKKRRQCALLVIVQLWHFKSTATSRLYCLSQGMWQCIHGRWARYGNISRRAWCCGSFIFAPWRPLGDLDCQCRSCGGRGYVLMYFLIV